MLKGEYKENILNKITYEHVKELVEKRGFELISKKYLGNNKSLTVQDREGFIYKTTYSSLKNKRKPLRFSPSNPNTIHNIKSWCLINKKPFELMDNNYKNNRTKMRWKCMKPDCGDVFLISWDGVYGGNGCGVCAGRQVGASNCLANKFPEISKEWDYSKNGEDAPCAITYGSSKIFWWKCKNNHEWKSTVYNRTNGYGCPYCAGQIASKNHNLLKYNLDLCLEWDYDKNIILPEDVTPFSSKKVFWKCKKCDNQWKASVAHRNNGKGCSKCNKSNGENKISEILQLKNISFESQKTFPNLLGLKNKRLSYDFYLPNYNLLIEYQGEYHDGTAKLQSLEGFKKQQEHDKRKKEFSQLNNIKLLEIWYWDYKNIESILKKELNV